MPRTVSFLLLSLSLMMTLPPAAYGACSGGALDNTVRTLNGDDRVRLCEKYANRVVLIVNTASKCAFTPQYDGLEALYEKYKQQGLVVLGFPSNDFANQEPGSEKEIADFCRLTYSVQFPMFEKIRVARDYAHPLYRDLADQAGGEYPAWNFHKYLLDRSGNVVASFASHVKPDDAKLLRAIEELL